MSRHETFGPADGTGRTWDDVLKEREADYAEKKRRALLSKSGAVELDDDLPEPGGEITITHPGREVHEGWPRAIGTWRNLLIAKDWQYKVGYSRAEVKDTFTKEGNVKKKAHVVENWWINAIKDGRYITISYYFENGKAVGGRTSRRVKGLFKNFSDAYMKEIIEGQDD